MTNPSNVMFSIFGFPIYWYSALMALGVMVAFFLAISEAKRKNVSEDTMWDLFIILVLSGIVGARLYYVIFEFDQFFGPGIPWWAAFNIRNGGLAIYGAVIGGALGLLCYCKVKKVNFLFLADLIVPGLVLAQSIGRWGNFFNQEAFGLPVTNPDLLWFPLSVKIDVPWNYGIHYFNGVLCEDPYHLATFFYESMWCLLIFLFLWFMLRKRAKHVGDMVIAYFILYSFERMFVESLRGDSLWLIDGVIRVSQFLSAILFVGLGIFLLARHLKEKKSGKLMWPAISPDMLAQSNAAIEIKESDIGSSDDSLPDENAIETSENEIASSDNSLPNRNETCNALEDEVNDDGGSNSVADDAAAGDTTDNSIAEEKIEVK